MFLNDITAKLLNKEAVLMINASHWQPTKAHSLL
jgi:hypothetical protein